MPTALNVKTITQHGTRTRDFYAVEPGDTAANVIASSRWIGVSNGTYATLSSAYRKHRPLLAHRTRARIASHFVQQFANVWGNNMNNLADIVLGNSSSASYNGVPVTLTPRQRDVLLLLCEGLPNKLISRRLRLSDATVKTHVASVLRGLNASNRLEAVTLAFRLGLVQTMDTSTEPDLELRSHEVRDRLHTNRSVLSTSVAMAA